MHSFKEHVDEASSLKFITLLPPKVRHAIKRYAHQDKYKGALYMYRSFLKNKDMQARGLSKKKMQDIAADHFGLDHREFYKILDRKTRYEEAPPGMSDTVKKFKADGMDDDKAFALAWSIYNKRNETISEAYTVAIDKDSEIDDLNYPKQSEKDALKLLYAHLKTTYPDFDNPLIFDPNPDSESSRRAVKVLSDLEAKGFSIVDVKKNNLTIDGKKIDWGSDLPPMKFGTGSADKKIDWTEFGISNNTKYIEFCQSIGFFLGKKLTPDTFVSELKDLTIKGDFKIREFIKDGPDGWEYFIDFCNVDPVLQKEVMLLVNGSFFYKEQIKIKSPYVLWTGIDTYYSNLKKKENIKGDIKPNTADCCLIENNTPEALYKALASKAPITTNELTGKLTCGKISWYQISLKKVRDGAQLGKLTTILKGTFDQKDTPLTVLAKIDDIYYAHNPEALGEDYDKQFDNLLIEGFFGDAVAKVKQLGGDAFDKLKSAVVNIMKFTGGLFKIMTKVLKQEEKKHDKIIDKITKKFLKEEALMESNKLLRERKKPTTAEKLDAIVREKDLNDAYKDVIMKSFNDVKTTFKKGTPIAFKKETQNIKKIEAGTINFLAGNVITFGMLNNITDKVEKKGIVFINDLNKSMLMGDTKIPVVKLYGHESKADSEILTVSKINQSDPRIEDKTIDLVKINIAPKSKSETYWVCNMWMFANMKDGVPRYHKVSFKKSGKGFNYNIEGTATYTADKITPFPMEKE